MKAVKVSDQVIELRDVPDPKGEGVIVAVKAVGICGSDLHLIDANMMVVTPGHEISGTTPNGKFVAIEPMLSCGNVLIAIGGHSPTVRALFQTQWGLE